MTSVIEPAREAGLPTHEAERIRIHRFSNRTNRTQFGQFGWGGNLRTEQVREAVESGGMEMVDVEPRGVFSRRERLQALISMSRDPAWTAKRNIKLLSYVAGLYCVYAQLFRSLGPGGVFLLEEPQQYPAYYAARDAGWSLVVTPQCLESLWPDHVDWVTGQAMPWSLEAELRHLELATAVFFISREEQWLSANRGLSSHYLPYYPPSFHREQLMADRRGRELITERPLEFLVMGTAANPNAVSGFREQATWLVDALRGTGARVHVVGAGTEKMREVWGDPLFEFHGLTPPEKLSDIKARVRACLLHSVQGHGALTRIPDMLVSGVPVIANPISCRSAWIYSGVHSYETPERMKQLLHGVDGMAPLLPPPDEHTHIFQNLLRRFAGNPLTAHRGRRAGGKPA